MIGSFALSLQFVIVPGTKQTQKNHISLLSKISFDIYIELLHLVFGIPKALDIFIQAHSDVDFGNCQLDKNITTGGCQFLDGKLVS